MAIRVEPGSEPITGYKLIERLGGGGFGEVWKVEAPGGLHKAIKIVYGDLNTTDADGTKRTEQELKALKRVQSVRHPYLLSLERYDIVEGRLLIVMELADRNLWDRFRECRSQGLPGIPRDELLRLMEESAEVLDLMNSEYALQHLDIKPQNLFLVRNHVKVADFGLVKDLEGMMATVTGGITPVYAAPETFDGKVSRFCDQYSLAIVYQELLTGQRPFSGTSLQQLIMQHLSAQPNLSPLPKSDRGPIGRSLSKTPEGRYASCTELIRALRAAGEEASRVAAIVSVPAGAEAPAPVEEAVLQPTPRPAASPRQSTASLRPAPPLPGAERPSPRPEQLRPEKPRPESAAPEPLYGGDLEASINEAAPQRSAPPCQTGDGVLFPALVIGLGEKGQQALKGLRETLVEHFGSMQAVPHIRLLYIDTDQDSITAAVKPNPGAPQANLTIAETLHVPLHRPAHYYRSVGGKLGVDWLHPKWIHRIPRNPATMGIRCLGRLAFVDQIRTIGGRIRAELEACVQPEALTVADRQTKLGLRSNYPRVYVVTGLSGGSGSGMFIDLGFLVRYHLHQLGYTDPDLFSILLLPGIDAQRVRPLAIGNAVASLIELQYFNSPQATFTFRPDGEGKVKDKDAPYRRTILLPMEPESDKQRAGESALLAGDFLFRELATPVGRMADTCRAPVVRPEGAPRASFNSVGLYRFTWPRRQLIQQVARHLCSRIVESWLSKDAGSVREAVQRWLNQELTRLELDAETVIGLLQDACEREAGRPPESIFDEIVEPFLPQGRRTPEPDPDEVRSVLKQFEPYLGTVQPEAPGSRETGSLVELMETVGETVSRKWGAKMIHLAISLVEDPGFRLRGAEEAIRQLSSIIDETIESHEPVLHDLEQGAAEDHERILTILDYLEQHPGRRTSAMVAELGERLRHYPRARYQGLILRRVSTIYITLRGKLSDELRELNYCRQRLADLARGFSEPVAAVARSVPGVNLLPAGCQTLDEAVEAFIEGLEEGDFLDLEQQIQEMIAQQFASLLQVCLNSANVVRSVEQEMLRIAEAFVAARLTDTNVMDMFFGQHEESSEDTVIAEITNAYHEAVPELGCKAAGSDPEIRVLALPAGEGAEEFRALVRKALTNIQLAITESTDDIIFYREQPGLMIEKLDLLGPAARKVYEQLCSSDNTECHSRIDITDWTPR